MPQLSARDLAGLLGVVRGAYRRRTSLALGRHLIHAVPGLIRSENCTYSELDPREQHRAAMELMNVTELLAPKAQAAFVRHMGEHPIIAYYARTGDGRARKTSDFLTRRQLEMLALYNEYVRPYAGTDHQVAIAISATPARVIGMSLARGGRDFSERDRLLLDLLRPHIAQARRTVGALERQASEIVALRRGIEAADVGIVVVDRAGRVRTMTTRARAWLADYFERPGGRALLPDAVWLWLREQSAPVNVGEPPRVLRPLMAARDGRELTIRIVPEGDGHLLLMGERRTAPDPAVLAPLGLTRREGEVLVWIAAAKTSAEIAAIIGGRPRTVEKHLERIYRKLGVENRTAAASMLRTVMART